MISRLLKLRRWRFPPPPPFGKTNPSTNRVRLLGGFCFSSYCQRFASLLEFRRYCPDHSIFGKLVTPRFSFASKFSAFLPPFSGPRPDSCIFSCNRCLAISSANWLILFMIPSNRSLMSMVGRSSFWFMPLLTGETEKVSGVG